MAFSMISQVLKELQDNGIYDVSKSVKSLEHLYKMFQNPALLKELYCQSEEDILAFGKLACTTYLCFLSSAKLARALDKVFKLLPLIYVNTINKEIEKELCQLLSQSNQKELKLLSLLLEQNSLAQSCVKKYFHEISKLLLNVLNFIKYGDKNKQTLEHLEYNHYVFKIIIQVEQIFQVEIKNLFNTQNTEDKLHTSHIEIDWEQIIGALLQILLQTSNRDILILIGTAISMSLNLSMPINCIRSIYMDLIDMLSKEKSSFFFKNVNICRREQDSEIDDMSNHKLAIIKGLLVCCDVRILSDDGGNLLLYIYPVLFKLCLGSVDYHYLAFQTLSLWYQKLAQLTQEERRALNIHLKKLEKSFDFENSFKSLTSKTCPNSSPENDDKNMLEVSFKESSHLALFSMNCPILKSTLSCIWLNWDSPVSGVPEYVAVIFSTLLNIWHSTFEKKSDNGQLCDILLLHVLNNNIQSRAKYRPLALLIPYIDGCKLIQENIHVRDELISCMKTNHLAAIATDIYKAFIEQLQLILGKESITQWKQLWMPALIAGLTSEDSLQRSKTCTYWLVPTLRIIPDSHTELLSSLEHYFLAESDRKSKYLYLFGWVNVLRFLRELICVTFPIESIQLLKLALCCPHDDVRSEALLVLCSTVKKAESLSELEINLLKTFIPNNMKTDSAPFRHCFVSGLRKVLVRIRDSCLTAVNKKRTEDFVDRSLIFVEWLYDVIMLALLPGSSYQCRRTAVDILTAILEILIFDENDTSKKGKAQESSEKLIQYAHSKTMWNFFSESNFVTVLICLEDGAREIQSLCYNLLDKYFKWQRDPADIHDKMTHMFKHASALLNSPRAYETHTGILIMSLIFKKYILDVGITFTSSYHEKSELHFQKDLSQLSLFINTTHLHPCIGFMDLLIRNVSDSLDVVLDNLASGFKTHPIHGWTSCVTQILSDVSKVWNKDIDSEAWNMRLQEIFNLNQAIINLMLDVMSGGKALDNSPSFAEMGKALSDLVEQDDEEELLSISPSFQLLLSWCWINIKESCACLGGLTHIVLLHPNKQLLSMDVLYNIGQIFVKVLTTCRHRGAIEGCRDGFFLFSHSLLSSHDPYLNNIPRSILEQILDSLSENSLSSSVTRRSAGLPIIVQMILQAAHKSKNFDLLASIVDRLYTIANKPLPLDPSHLQDLSQSHALNILKVIFCDALLAPMLMSQLSKMTILVIEGFDSPSWAIRNAATQLISTLISRILGQKNQLRSNLTLAEFSALYPELLNYLVCKLQLSVTSTKSTSLYIVLTIMSKLSSDLLHQHETDLCTSLQSTISSFISNPVHSLRKLSAKAFVTLSPFDKIDDTLVSILLKVRHRHIRKNELHGWLLCIQDLLQSESASSNMVLKVIDFFLSNSWLLNDTPCMMITRAIMNIVQKCLSHIILTVDTREKLWSFIEILMKTFDAPVGHVQIDGFHCFRTCLQTLLNISTNNSSKNDNYSVKFLEILNKSLSSTLDDLRITALDCLEECVASDHFISDSSIQKTLLAQLFKENTAYHVVKIADIILKLKMNGHLAQDIFDVNIDITFLRMKWKHNASVSQVLFTIEGLIFGFAKDIQLVDCFNELCLWSEHLLNISNPSVNESSRLLAAQVLCIAGQNIIEFCCRNTTLASVDDVVTRIIRACILLLEDTETEVREIIANFICQFENETSYHYTLCYSILTRLIVKLSWCSSLMFALLDILFTPGHLSDSLQVCLDDKLHQLFEPELTSAFSEPHKLQIWASNTLELLTEHECLSRMLKVKIKAALTELTMKKTEILESAKRNVIFNASCNARVISAMLGIILLSHLYQTSLKQQPASKSEEGDKLSVCVNWLQQIVSLHPLLHKSHLDFRHLMPLLLTE